MTTDHVEMHQVTLARPGVLVVDDSQVVRKAIQRILARDFTVTEAKDGESGWDIISRDHEIQVVFADLMMPNKNGFELLRDIRESVHARINRLPVIIMTGHEDDEKMRHQALLLGASDFIAKPFDSIQLKTRATVHAKADHTRRQLEQAHELLAKKSTIDPLTGLANQAYVQDHVPRLIALTARQGAELAVFYVELDRFDAFFKKKGRQIAEKVLIHVSQIINSCARKEDIVARIGLSRFAIIMPRLNQDAAAESAQRIHAAIGLSIYRLGTTQFRLTASAALMSHVPSPGVRAEEILSLAEAQLLHVMREGGDHLTVGAPERPNAASPDLEAKSTLASLTLDEAIRQLVAGRTDEVDEHLNVLVAQVIPLLDYANYRLHLQLDQSLAPLRGRFAAA